jgi:hypothetical protein
MFLKAVNTGGETKDTAYIAEQLIDCIREVGADSVIQVVTDSAAVCKAVGRLVEQEFSWITWTPCTPHCLDLLKPGDTHFATNFIMLDRMLEVKEALQELVVGREWREWNRKSNHSDDRDKVRDCVLRSGFWKNLKKVLALTKGTVALLRECDRGVLIAG